MGVRGCGHFSSWQPPLLHLPLTRTPAHTCTHKTGHVALKSRLHHYYLSPCRQLGCFVLDASVSLPAKCIGITTPISFHLRKVEWVNTGKMLKAVPCMVRTISKWLFLFSHCHHHHRQYLLFPLALCSVTLSRPTEHRGYWAPAQLNQPQLPAYRHLQALAKTAYSTVCR